MSDLRVRCYPERSEALTNERFKVKTSIKNEGSEPERLRLADASLSFALRRGAESLQVSRADYVALLAAPEEPTEGLVEDVELAPGKVKVVADDVALYFAEAPPPGTYELRVTYRSGESVESEPADVRYVAPRVAAYASLVCPYSGHLVSGLAHRGEEHTTLLLREASPSTPLAGTFVRVVEGGSGASGLAVAANTGYAEFMDEGRWFLALEGSALVAARAAGTLVTARPGGANTSLESARLVEPGFQLPDADPALFLVAGLANGEGRVQAWQVTGGGLEKVGPAQALGAGLPTSLVAAAPRGVAAPIQVLWGAREGETTRLWRLDCVHQTGAEPVSPVVLDERPDTLLALAAEPASPNGPLRAAALFGRVDRVERAGEEVDVLVLTHLSLSLEGGEPRATLFASPLERAAVSEWFVAAAPYGEVLPVLARAAATVYWGDARRPDAEWKSVSVPHEATQLKVLDCQEAGLWLSWIEPDYGVRYAELIPGR